MNLFHAKTCACALRAPAPPKSIPFTVEKLTRTNGILVLKTSRISGRLARSVQASAAYSGSAGPTSARNAAPPAPTTAPRRAAPSPDEVYLPRSLIMDKEVITRTSGKRLGYVNQLYVDPSRLEVVSVYLRQGMTSIGASNTDHVMVSSLRQIGDVVLVHDEGALLDPPADEMYGYVRMVGTEVQTEDGTSLGKVRDYVFNPDNGQIVSIRYDALGIPSIPQPLLSCYSLSWQDIVAVGPTKTIVRRGAERRAVKENEGWVTEYVGALVNALAGGDEDDGLTAASGGEAYRGDPAYAAWYQQHAAAYEQYYGQKLPKPIVPPPRQQQQQPPQKVQQQRRRQAQQPMALPPPRSTPYRQAVRPSEERRQPVMQQPAPGREQMYAEPRRQQPRPQATTARRQMPQPQPPAGARPSSDVSRPPAQPSAATRAAPAQSRPAPRTPLIEPDAVISGEYQGSSAPERAPSVEQPADYKQSLNSSVPKRDMPPMGRS